MLAMKTILQSHKKIKLILKFLPQIISIANFTYFTKLEGAFGTIIPLQNDLGTFIMLP